MTTRLPRRVLKTDSRSGVLALAAALALMVSMALSFFSSPASAAVLSKNDNVAICHHDNGVKVYNYISPNVDSIVRASGHDSHADDIIPSFDYDLGKGAGTQHYPGKNLALLSTLNNGCVPPPGGPGGPTHVAPGAVGVNPSVCAGNPSAPTTPSFTVPSTPGITYSPASGGPATPNTTVDVTATANAGYVIDIGGVLSPSVVLHAPIGPLASGCGGSVVVTPTPADENLGVSKTGTGTAHPGDELVWNVVVSNTAGTPATAFTVTDTLPAGLAFSSAGGTGFSCSAAGQLITCAFSGSLAVGQSATIVVRALLDSSFSGTSVSNTAVVDPGRSDSNAGDNISTATTTVTPLPTAGGGGPVAGGTTGGAVAPPTKPVVKPVAGGGGGGGALPFTGSHTAQLVQTGLAMFLLGWYFVTVGRRRPAHVR